MSNAILVLNGPNLNLLGSREPDLYGHATLADIEARCRARAGELGLDIDFRQSNDESELVGWIQDTPGKFDALVINPAAFTHTSVAIMDALLATGIPAIEVHLSNIHQREEFRRHSYIAKAAKGMICGLGAVGYLLALDAAADLLKAEP